MMLVNGQTPSCCFVARLQSRTFVIFNSSQVARAKPAPLTGNITLRNSVIIRVCIGAVGMQLSYKIVQNKGKINKIDLSVLLCV